MANVAAVFLLVGGGSAAPSWNEYKAKYGLVFNSEGSEVAANQNYDANVALINGHNLADTSYQMGVNQFSWYSESEFQAAFTGELPDAEDNTVKFEDEEVSTEVASSVDWSTRSDIVNPVKNQGSCGSCWAFGAVATLETSWALDKGTLFSLSEQQLVDCDKSSSGCSGGLSRYSLSNYYPSHGACSGSSYTYTATGGSCRDSSCSVLIPAGSVAGYNSVSTNDAALQSALNGRPVKVSVYADSAWQSYSSGILSGQSSCHSGTNHAVLGVGYSSGSYWKIRNSWGSSWGEHGYIRMSQSSSCSSGPWSIFGRTPVYPKFASQITV